MQEVDTKQYFKLRTKKEKQIAIQELKGYMNWFERNFKVHTYLIYGTLLGAYREHKFISHDYDIDIAYLSRYTEMSKIIQEKNKINKELNRQKMIARDFGDGHIHAKVLSKSFLLDLWSSWFDKDGKFYCTGFYNGCIDKSVVLPFSTCVLENEIFNIPNDTDKFLTVYYGDWRTPQLMWKQETPWVGLKNE